MKFKNQKNSMKSKIKVRTSWGMTNSDCVLEQEITLNCENINELIEEFKKELFNQTPTNSEVQLECHVEEFSEKERFSKFYNELLLCLGEINYFEISIEDELKKHLSVEQLKNIDDAYMWGLNVLYEQDIHLQDRLLMSLSIYDSLIVPLSDFGFDIKDNEDGIYIFTEPTTSMELILNEECNTITVNELFNSHIGFLVSLIEISLTTDYNVLFLGYSDFIEDLFDEVKSRNLLTN
jgi:hypothetical protein